MRKIMKIKKPKKVSPIIITPSNIEDITINYTFNEEGVVYKKIQIEKGAKFINFYSFDLLLFTIALKEKE